MSHHHLARIAGLEEKFVVFRPDYLVVPRHIAIALYFLVIEESTHEIGETVVVVAGIYVVTVSAMLEIEIDFAQVAPIPAALGGRKPVAQKDIGKDILYHIVGTHVVKIVGIGEHGIVGIGPQAQLRFVREIRLGRDRILGNQIQIGTAEQSGSDQHAGYI